MKKRTIYMYTPYLLDPILHELVRVGHMCWPNAAY